MLEAERAGLEPGPCESSLAVRCQSIEVTPMSITLLACGGIGLAIFLIAFFRDRSTARRCRRCWYHMEGAPSLTCPECGHVAARESDLHRRRRHWRIAVPGLAVFIGCTAAAGAMVIEMSRWIAMLPTDALIALTPKAGHESHQDSNGAWVANPVAAELRSRFESDGFTDRQWRRVLTRTGVIQWRRRWPVPQEVVVGMHEPYWFGIGEIRLARRDEPAQHAKLGSFNVILGWNEKELRRQSQMHQQIGAIVEGNRSLTFDVSVVVPESIDFIAEGEREIWAGEISIPVRAVEHVEDAIAFVDDPYELEESFSARARWHTSRWRTCLVVSVEVDERVSDVAFGMHVDVLHEGELIHTQPMCGTPMIDDGLIGAPPRPGWTAHTFIDAEHLLELGDASVCHLRFRGDPVLSLGAFGFNKAWTGELELTEQPIDR